MRTCSHNLSCEVGIACLTNLGKNACPFDEVPPIRAYTRHDIGYIRVNLAHFAAGTNHKWGRKATFRRQYNAILRHYTQGQASLNPRQHHVIDASIS